MCGALIVFTALALGAAPPPYLTPQQQKTLGELRELWQESRRLWRAGKQDAALAMLRKVLDAQSATIGPYHGATIETLTVLANMHQLRGEFTKEAEYRRAALEARKRLNGEAHWRTVDARLAMEEALAQAKRTPAQRQALARAKALENQAMDCYRKGEPARALSPARRASDIRKEVLGEMHPTYCQSLHLVAALLRLVGDHKAALPGQLRALKATKAAYGERHPSYIACLSNLAADYREMGDHKAALPLARQVLALQLELFGEDHADTATYLNNLALVFKDMGDYKAALPLARRGLSVIRSTLGERHPDYPTSLNNLASLYEAMGDYKAALPLFKQALALLQKTAREKHPLFAMTLLNLAVAHAQMGDHKESLRLYRQALPLIKAAYGEKHPSYAGALTGLSELYHLMGDPKTALPLCQQALKIKVGLFGQKHPSSITSLNNLAALHLSLGEIKQALPMYQKALKLTAEALGEKHPDYANSLNNLATAHMATGDHKAALPPCLKAATILKGLGEKHPRYGLALNNLAVVYIAAGDRTQALRHSEASLAIALEHLRSLASVQSDRQQFAAAEDLRDRLDTRLSLPDASGHPSSAQHVLAWKGAILLRQQHRRLFLRLAQGPATRRAAARLEEATRRLVALRLGPPAARAKMEELERGLDEAQAELSRLSADFRDALNKEKATPEALSKALPEGAVLVDFLFFDLFDVKAGKKAMGDRHLVAFVHRKGKPPSRVGLGPAASVSMGAARWRSALLKGQAGRPEGAALKKLIWAPLEKHLAGAKAVLVSPDGVLGTIPFAALPGSKEGTYLIEEVPLAVVPVPSAIPEMMQPKKGRLKPSLLVTAGLRYDPEEKAAAPPAGPDDRSAPRTGRERFASLPATRAEARAVKASFAELFKGGKVTELSEGKATKSAVRKALGRVRYAHIATHGFFAPEAARKPRPGGRPEAADWHPLLLSGLALSDANREPKPGEEDGILTALEVSEMDLTKLELVVLSACETGLGKEEAGEGLLGLQRAFQAAGARTVVASLWKVDDKATQALMAEFYARAWDTRKIISRAEALRQAQLMLLREGHKRGVGKVGEKLPAGKTRLPPLYWAAFVLSGDWR
jgi:CHAT domain-containing protein